MINAQGVPRLADFGLSSIAKTICSVSESNAAGGGSVRWSAPELVTSITTRRVRPTAQSDIYALAMVIIEVIYVFLTSSARLPHERSISHLKVFTGRIPFPDANNVQVILLISKGKRPPKPAGGEALGLVPALWRLTEECWRQNPERRPDIDNVLRRFKT